MSTTELTALCTEYKELQRLREEITAEMETISDTIKAAMGTTEKLVAGQYKIMYTTVNGSRLDTTKLKKALPEIAAAFTIPTHSRRFTIN